MDTKVTDTLPRMGKLAPADLERLLNTYEALRAMSPGQRRQVLEQLTQRKRTLQHLTCSEAWFSHCWSTGETFPPPAETTPMQPCTCDRCQQSGRVWPHGYQASPHAHRRNDESSPSSPTLSYECYLESLDDWHAAQLPSSPSGLALRAIREGRIKLRRRRTHMKKR